MLQVKRSTIFLYLLPIIVSITFISMTPILYTLYLSFTNNTEFNQEYKFVGLTNYIHLLFTSNSDLFYVLRQTVLYVIACTLLFVLVGMITATALNNPKVKGTAVWMSLLLLPWAAPSAVTALIWKFLFNFDFGPINQIGRLFFGSHFGVAWITDPTAAFIAVVIVNVWLSYPFFTVVILGALQSVPLELSEAARVDGANAWQAYWRITIPLVRPAIIPATILSAIGTFQMFNTVYLITAGGPITSADKPGATSFVMIYMYNQVLGASAANIHYGAIAAFAITMFIVLAAVTFLARALSTQSSRIREARA